MVDRPGQNHEVNGEVQRRVEQNASMKACLPLPGCPSPLAAVLLSLLVVCCSAGCQPGTAQAPSGTIPSFGHVFVIVMENKSYSEIIGSPEAPYINQLAHTYASAAHYYAIRHPSLPNYLALTSGSTQGMVSDCPNCSFNVRNLVDQLEEQKKGWKAFMEDLPSPCFDGVSAGPVDSVGSPLYARKHNPCMYFKDIRGNPQRCNQVVPLTQFSSDLQKNQLPDLVWITPNLVHDMHDGTIRDGDSWLASFVPQILNSAAWKDNGVLFLLWDEGQGSAGCCGDAAGGQAPALVIAAKGKRGFQSDVNYTHYSVLRTIEDAWQLGTLGGSGDPGTLPMADFFP